MKPLVSVIVPAYNVAAYLDGCLSSLSAQVYDRIEILVVNDGSSDSSAAITRRHAAQDRRIRLIEHAENQGLHQVRMSGVEAASGDFGLFLDGDDKASATFIQELIARLNTLEETPDALHFGQTLLSTEAVSEAARVGFEEFLNRSYEPHYGNGVLRQIFDPKLGFKIDWQVTNRLYRMDVLKQGFGQMAKIRLNRAEDAYEGFVLADHTRSVVCAKDCAGYLYRHGAGVTGESQISVAKYGEFCHQFLACLKQIAAYSQTHPDPDYQLKCRCANGAFLKCVELLFNEWLTRVSAEDKVAAAQAFRQVFGSPVLLRELYRIVRDRIYHFFHHKEVISEDDQLYCWIELIAQIEADDQDCGLGEYLAPKVASAGEAASLSELDIWEAIGENPWPTGAHLERLLCQMRREATWLLCEHDPLPQVSLLNLPLQIVVTGTEPGLQDLWGSPDQLPWLSGIFPLPINPWVAKLLAARQLPKFVLKNGTIAAAAWLRQYPGGAYLGVFPNRAAFDPVSLNQYIVSSSPDFFVAPSVVLADQSRTQLGRQFYLQAEGITPRTLMQIVKTATRLDPSLARQIVSVLMGKTLRLRDGFVMSRDCYLQFYDRLEPILTALHREEIITEPSGMRASWHLLFNAYLRLIETKRPDLLIQELPVADRSC